jgi:cation diffusion facilitator family transporter
MVLLAIPLIMLWRQESRGAAARAQALEIRNDELSSVAAVVGIIFMMYGFPIVDPSATVVVAALIAINGYRLFRENLCFLMGRSPGQEFLAKVEGLARSVEGVLGVHELRAEYVGPDTVHTGMHIEVRRGMPVEEADRIAEEVRERIHGETGCRYCVIHTDAAGSDQARTGGA